MTNSSEQISMQDAANLAGVTPVALTNYINSRRLWRTRKRGKYYIYRHDVDEYIRKRSTGLLRQEAWELRAQGKLSSPRTGPRLEDEAREKEVKWRERSERDEAATSETTTSILAPMREQPPDVPPRTTTVTEIEPSKIGSEFAVLRAHIKHQRDELRQRIDAITYQINKLTDDRMMAELEIEDTEKKLGYIDALEETAKSLPILRAAS